MSWRLAAAWALLGFSSQCLMAALSGFDLVTGLERAMIHYLAWGLAGFFAGDLMERIVEDSFRRRFLQTRTKEQATSPIRAEPTP